MIALVSKIHRRVTQRQAQKSHDAKRPQTAITIKIEISDVELRSYNEADLLRAAIGKLEFDGKFKIDGRKAIISIIDRSGALVDKALHDKTYLGGERWILIERMIELPIYQRWLRLKAEDTGVPDGSTAATVA